MARSCRIRVREAPASTQDAGAKIIHAAPNARIEHLHKVDL